MTIGTQYSPVLIDLMIELITKFRYIPPCCSHFIVTCRFDDTFKTEEGSQEVLMAAKDFLLQGLADENKDIRYPETKKFHTNPFSHAGHFDYFTLANGRLFYSSMWKVCD